MIILITFLVILAVVLLLTLMWTIGVYNRFQILAQDIKNQFSNVKTEYQRRVDLFCNLVASVKSSAKFEKSTQRDVTMLRNTNLATISTVNAKKAMSQIDSILSKLMVTVENYPTLRSTEEFARIMEDIRQTEDRVNIARTDFNDIVREYNVYVKTFPSSIIANMFNFSEQRFFLNEEGTDKSPKIDYGEI